MTAYPILGQVAVEAELARLIGEELPAIAIQGSRGRQALVIDQNERGVAGSAVTVRRIVVPAEGIYWDAEAV